MSVVRLEHVSKQFTLERERPRSFQELFLNLKRMRRRDNREKIWALNDVSLAIQAGEMVGIVGDNGAGKSTLLKLLTRIIEPSQGVITVQGRVSALLELGAGFHPDLTGRENVYLNGSVLGFSRAEMNGLFEQILEFSELERFIDVPVKHYSSGMYMRLAFSIAIHVRPDVLLVDEILAVGDQAFQLRCLDKINELKRHGVTIVLITHDLQTVRTLCDRAVWLDDGKVRAVGNVDYVLEQYLAQVRAADRDALHQAEAGALVGTVASTANGTPPRWGSGEVEITDLQFLDARGEEQRTFMTGEPFVVRLHYCARCRIERPQFGVALYHANGFHINGPNTVFAGLEIDAVEGAGTVEHVVDRLPLMEGTYLLSAAVYDHDGQHAYDHHHHAYTFRVRANPAIREKYGSILIPNTWRIGPAPAELKQQAEQAAGHLEIGADGAPGRVDRP